MSIEYQIALITFPSKLSKYPPGVFKMVSAHKITRVGDAGVATVEGSVSGARSVQLAKQRAIEAEDYKTREEHIRQQNQSQVNKFGDKFSAAESVADATLRNSTVGLMSAADYELALGQSKAAMGKAPPVLNDTEQDQGRDKSKSNGKGKGKGKASKRKTHALSFGFEDEDDQGGDKSEGIKEDSGNGVSEPVAKKRAVMKDPTVLTAFLPDRERDAQVEKEKERLRQQWLQEQAVVQKQRLEVVYSFWDGSGHRKTLTLEKGATIEAFLGRVQRQCSEEFRDLRAAGADNLMYVKEDLVIPHHLSFYDLIVTRARGKSGPLFNFDVHDDVRLISDARVEKDESHPGKVCLRSWYEKNKHIFPASRWEVYDPAKSRDDRYTIHGK